MKLVAAGQPFIVVKGMNTGCICAGALIASNSDLSIFDSMFHNNTGYQSGAINLVGGRLSINGSEFFSNSGPQVLDLTQEVPLQKGLH